MRMQTEVLVERYQQNMFAAALSACKDPQDAEDAVQEALLAYHTSGKEFESEEHIRAWLLRVAINKAKNMRMSFWKKHKVSLEDYIESISFETEQESGLFEAVMELPEKYRVVLHLYYYEDYSIREIGKILRRTENTVKSQLSRGRALLKESFKGGMER